MKKLTTMYVWVSEAVDYPPREMIPAAKMADGSEVQLAYSNNAPDNFGLICDQIAKRSARQYGKKMRLLRFDAKGVTEMKRY